MVNDCSFSLDKNVSAYPDIGLVVSFILYNFIYQFSLLYV